MLAVYLKAKSMQMDGPYVHISGNYKCLKQFHRMSIHGIFNNLIQSVNIALLLSKCKILYKHNFSSYYLYAHKLMLTMACVWMCICWYCAASPMPSLVKVNTKNLQYSKIIINKGQTSYSTYFPAILLTLHIRYRI